MKEQNGEISLKIGNKAEETFTCTSCHEEHDASEKHVFKDKKGGDIYFCDTCVKSINAALDEETKNPNLALGLAGGMAAGLIGGGGWYLFTITTEREIGYLAIALGWLIAMGIYFGSGKKKGGKLQIMAGVITMISILVSEVFIFNHFLSVEVSKITGAMVSEWSLIPQMLGDPEMTSEATRMFFSTAFSPISLLIWGLGVYSSIRTLQAKKLK